ncbi:MAG: sodium:calcium antiporter [Chloroflexi bacterium]|nr:sodium:calcium antiporter [Chloroflexota bacterium]
MNLLIFALAAAVTLPGLYLRLSGQVHPFASPLNAAIFGAAVVGAAFILSWAAEAAEMDISQGLAIAFLALIAVLPEYAVDMYLAWQAGLFAAASPGETNTYASLATANMTGANRLLIGVAWSMIVFLYWWRFRQRAVEIREGLSVEIVFLTLATAYAFIVPWKGSLTLLDTLVFVALFVAYISIIARAEAEEPELVGPALTLGMMPAIQRRLAVLVLFLFAAAVILASAEPFAENLISTGKQFGVSEFFLIQWLAPLASEAPEVIVAFLFAWRGHAVKGLAALISSKVNQWTLLVGTLPVVYSAGLGGLGALPLDSHQIEEIVLTAAQSAFAIAILANLRVTLREATLLFVLFSTQLVFTDPTIRWVYVGIYLALTVVVLMADRSRLGNIVQVFVRALKQGR